MALSVAALPPYSLTLRGKRQGEQHFSNIITIFHFATTSQQGGRWEFSFYFQKVTSESMKGVLRERESVVCETAA